MRIYTNRRMVYIFSLALFLLFLGYTIPGISALRERMTHEYFKHKEFLMNLKSVRGERRKPPTEKSIRDLMRRLGIEPKSVYASSSGIEIKFKLSWDKLPFLVKEIERSHRIVSLSAVDNTGKGMFEVRLIVR